MGNSKVKVWLTPGEARALDLILDNGFDNGEFEAYIKEVSGPGGVSCARKGLEKWRAALQQAGVFKK